MFVPHPHIDSPVADRCQWRRCWRRRLYGRCHNIVSRCRVFVSRRTSRGYPL